MMEAIKTKGSVQTMAAMVTSLSVTLIAKHKMEERKPSRVPIYGIDQCLFSYKSTYVSIVLSPISVSTFPQVQHRSVCTKETG